MVCFSRMFYSYVLFVCFICMFYSHVLFQCFFSVCSFSNHFFKSSYKKQLNDWQTKIIRNFFFFRRELSLAKNLKRRVRVKENFRGWGVKILLKILFRFVKFPRSPKHFVINVIFQLVLGFGSTYNLAFPLETIKRKPW